MGENIKVLFRSAQTRPVGRAHAPKHLEERHGRSPNPKSPVDALESSAATATLPSYSSSSSYLIVFCFSLPCVYLPLVSVCLSFVYYPSPPLTTHVCLFLLSRDPSPLGPYSLVTAITKFAPTPSSFSPSLNATLFSDLRSIHRREGGIGKRKFLQETN